MIFLENLVLQADMNLELECQAKLFLQNIHPYTSCFTWTENSSKLQRFRISLGIFNHQTPHRLQKRQDVDLVKLTGGGLTGNVESSKLAGGSYEDKMNAAPAAVAAAPVANGGGGTSVLSSCC